MKKRTAEIFMCLVGVFLTVWLFALAKTEITTALHKSEFIFDNSYNTTQEIMYLKVLSYNDEEAEVYFMLNEHKAAYTLKFENESGTWKETGLMDAIFSTEGSASETIWPYWYHFIYGGF